MAEHLLRHALASKGLPVDAVEVASAGVRAYAGYPMDERAASLLRARDIAGIDSFRTRSLAAADVRDADLVLTAERFHRDEAVALAPTASRRVFTLREFGWLLAGVDGSALPAGETRRGEEVVRAAAEQRGNRRPATPADLDLADPVALDSTAFQQCAQRIDDALAPLVALLTRPV